MQPSNAMYPTEHFDSTNQHTNHPTINNTAQPTTVTGGSTSSLQPLWLPLQKVSLESGLKLVSTQEFKPPPFSSTTLWALLGTQDQDLEIFPKYKLVVLINFKTYRP